jgi:hypothetical protein
MSELLQEYVDSRRQQLRVDRAAGVIRGVKLLGLSSRNGRRYRENALVEAAGLYEGAKVNINHPKGHPLSPRDYQDRLGVVRGVQFRAGDGLFGDLHFNPKHAISEQLVWDAEHAPHNVGMSHNVLARTSRSGDETVVEAITKVQSIDLVADPATTAGLYEHVEGRESKVEGRGPEGGEPTGTSLTVGSLTLAQLRECRPDLVGAIEHDCDVHFERVRTQLEAMVVREESQRRRERILQLLQEHDLPLPSGDGAAESQLVSAPFIETLLRIDDDHRVQTLIEERAALVRSAFEWRSNQHLPLARRPRSRDQVSLDGRSAGRRECSAQEFAASIRG